MEECAHRTQIPPLPAKENQYLFGKSRVITLEQRKLTWKKDDK
jgi:hypothetical protein